MKSILKFIFLFSTITVIISCGSRKHLQTKKSDEQNEYYAKLPVVFDKKDNKNLYKLIAEWYGIPHKDGGCDKNGTDCSCFVQMVIKEVYGKELPRSSAEMYNKTERVDSLEMKEGDLVFFTTKSTSVSHVGVYLKENWFVHVSSSKGVRINNLTEPYFQKSYAGAGKFQ